MFIGDQDSVQIVTRGITLRCNLIYVPTLGGGNWSRSSPGVGSRKFRERGGPSENL